MESNYKPNSHRSKENKQSGEERKKLEKVVKGTAKVKKKSEIRKFTDVFISEDSSSVKSYIFADVFVPAVKKLISDIVKDGIEMILYGGTSRKGDRSDRFGAGYISYNKYSDRRDDRRPNYSRSQSRLNYDDIILETRGEAEEVLSRLDELIDMYGVVSIADLYDLVGISCSYTFEKYGWTNIRNAEIVRVRDGYLLKLPKVGPIDD
jgi:hypothetical protein